jgi:hypothetical protein
MEMRLADVYSRLHGTGSQPALLTPKGAAAVEKVVAKLPPVFYPELLQVLEEHAGPMPNISPQHHRAQNLISESQLLNQLATLERTASTWQAEVDLAKRKALAPETLQALRERRDVVRPVEGTKCCLFRSSYREWRRTPKRVAAEQRFIQTARAEEFRRDRQRILVVSDATHVIDAFQGAAGIPRKYRLNRDAGVDVTSLKKAIRDLGLSYSGKPRPELLLVTHHDRGLIAVGAAPKHAAVPYKDLAVYAAEHGVLLRLLGCRSGLSAPMGVQQAFNGLPLVQALARVMRDNKVYSRMDYYEAISRETGLRFVFDVLALSNVESVAERAELKAELSAIGSDLGAIAPNQITYFSLGAPSGYFVGDESDLAGPLSPEAKALKF